MSTSADPISASSHHSGSLLDADAGPTAYPPPQTIERRRSWWPGRRREPYLGGARRVVGLDAARGLAVIGMIIAHAGAVGVWGEDLSALLGIAHGHSSILFAVVAGISLGIITGGTTPPAGALLLRARLRVGARAAGLLVISGLVDILPSGVAVILASYALWFALMIPFLRWRPRALIIAGAAHAIFGWLVIELSLFVLSLADIHPYPGAESFVPGLMLTGVYPALVWMGFVFIGMAMARSGIAETGSLVRFGAAGLALFVAFSAPFVIMERSLAPIFGTYDYSDEMPGGSAEDWCLDAEAGELYPCTVGEYEAQAEEFSPEEEDLYWELYDQLWAQEPNDWCLDAEAAELYPCTVSEYEAQAAEFSPEENELYWDLYEDVAWGEQDHEVSPWFTMAPHSGTPFEALSSGGLAMFVVAAFVLAGRIRVVRWLLAPVIVMGSMALTAYVAHIVVLAYVPNPGDTNAYAFTLIASIVVGCAVWRGFLAAGPLENLLGAVADRAATTRDVPRG